MKSLIRVSKRLVREYVLYRPSHALPRTTNVISAEELISGYAGRTLLVAAHQDDEAIGGAILLHRLPNAEVLHVTDGAPRDGKSAQNAGFSGPVEYACARQREAEAAVSLIGARIATRNFPPIPDQEVPANAAQVAIALRSLLVNYDAVVTHAYEGGHPDHDATAFAVHAALRLLEHDGASISVFEMAGYNGWGGYATSGSFIPQSRSPIAEVAFTSAEWELKRKVFDCYVTQKKVLETLGVSVERFRAAPRYDFRKPPHRGPLYYDRFGWNFSRSSWIEAMSGALNEIGIEAGAI